MGLLPGAEADSLANNDRISMTQSAVVLENIISQFLYNKSGDAGSGDKGLK